MKRKLLKLRYRLMSTRYLLFLNDMPEIHYIVASEILSERYPDDDEFEAPAERMHAGADGEEISKVYVSEILSHLN